MLLSPFFCFCTRGHQQTAGLKQTAWALYASLGDILFGYEKWQGHTTLSAVVLTDPLISSNSNVSVDIVYLLWLAAEEQQVEWQAFPDPCMCF